MDANARSPDGDLRLKRGNRWGYPGGGRDRSPLSRGAPPASPSTPVAGSLKLYPT